MSDNNQAPSLPHVLSSPRLILRPFRRSDEVRLVEIAGDYSVSSMCRLIPHPYSLADAERFIGEICSPGSVFAVTIRYGDDTAIGCVSLSNVRAFSDDPTEFRGSLGFLLAPDFWGHGYATEAVSTVLRAAFSGGFRRIDSAHWVDNEASSRVHDKLGFGSAGSSSAFCLARGVEVEEVARFLRRRPDSSRALDSLSPLEAWRFLRRRQCAVFAVNVFIKKKNLSLVIT